MALTSTLADERAPVWSALSELFLDTKLEETDFERIAGQLVSSSYSTEKIEEILRFEVTPLLKWNLRCIAGEWAGFDEAWLVEKLTSKIDAKPFLRFGVSRMIRSDWEQIKRRIKQTRNEEKA